VLGVTEEAVDDVVAIKTNIIQGFDIRPHGVRKACMEEGSFKIFWFHVGIREGSLAVIAVMVVLRSRKF
tara:strand:- start:1317 stop:1523 length:207 start_codon:yes stop_codon:yes gene_type:complete